MPSGEHMMKLARPERVIERLTADSKRLRRLCVSPQQRDICAMLDEVLRRANTAFSVELISLAIPENSDHPERNSYFKICADYYNKFLIFSRDNYDETLRNHAWTKFTDSFIRLLPPDKQRFGETYECLDKDWYKQLLTVTASS
jgi:hypothetical protein